MEITLKTDNFQAMQEVIAFAEAKEVQILTNNLCLKTVGELLTLPEPFFVDSYQRGYKWESQQVQDLLEDIYSFDTKNHSFYCLQPVVVKHIEQDKKWELIDGQQRMTTIYLILTFLEKKDKYEIDYKTRTGSADFLKTILKASNYTDFNDYIAKEGKKDNIDNYYFFNAFQTIKKWFIGKDTDKFYKTITEYTKVIWYEVDNVDSRDIFARLNSGKIPLTNAELIKALFLQSSNKEKITQTELAQEWDSIERALQNDSFWYFLNNKEKEKPTRIELIFDLITKKNEKNADAYYSFREFSKKDNLSDAWKEVKSYFATLQEWFEDRELYHYIGYLLCFGEKITNLITKSKDKTKSTFRELLKGDIKITLGKVQLDELEYGNGGVAKVLLLFNIQTILDNDKSNMRFPFDLYKNQDWDIEHIHSQESDAPKDNPKRKKWLEVILWYFTGKDRDVKQKDIDSLNDEKGLVQEVFGIFNEKEIDEEKFNKCFENVRIYFTPKDKYFEGNKLYNLALLDSSTNRSYKNAPFPIKRKILIEKDAKGTFVPTCTKNVFLKYYSRKFDNLMFWQETDAENYEEAIKTTLKEFLPTQNNN